MSVGIIKWTNPSSFPWWEGEKNYEVLRTKTSYLTDSQSAWAFLLPTHMGSGQIVKIQVGCCETASFPSLCCTVLGQGEWAFPGQIRTLPALSNSQPMKLHPSVSTAVSKNLVLSWCTGQVSSGTLFRWQRSDFAIRTNKQPGSHFICFLQYISNLQIASA